MSFFKRKKEKYCLLSHKTLGIISAFIVIVVLVIVFVADSNMEKNNSKNLDNTSDFINTSYKTMK